MLKNHRLAGTIADVGFHEFRRQLAYKAERGGNLLNIVDRWFPSTKRCSHCLSVKNDMPLDERRFRGDTCGLVIDRDLNAALNLLSTVSSTGLQACGEASSGSPLKGRAKLASAKQEPERV